jgi:hypothetical protein
MAQQVVLETDMTSNWAAPFQSSSNSLEKKIKYYIELLDAVESRIIKSLEILRHDYIVDEKSDYDATTILNKRETFTTKENVRKVIYRLSFQTTFCHRRTVTELRPMLI